MRICTCFFSQTFEKHVRQIKQGKKCGNSCIWWKAYEMWRIGGWRKLQRWRWIDFGCLGYFCSFVNKSQIGLIVVEPSSPSMFDSRINQYYFLMLFIDHFRFFIFVFWSKISMLLFLSIWESMYLRVID